MCFVSTVYGAFKTLTGLLLGSLKAARRRAADSVASLCESKRTVACVGQSAASFLFTRSSKPLRCALERSVLPASLLSPRRLSIPGSKRVTKLPCADKIEHSSFFSAHFNFDRRTVFSNMASCAILFWGAAFPLFPHGSHTVKVKKGNYPPLELYLLPKLGWKTYKCHLSTSKHTRLKK